MYSSNSTINHIPGLPEETYWQALEQSAQQGLSELKATQTRQAKLHELRRAYSKELHQATGKDNWQRYLELQKTYTERVRAVQTSLPATKADYEKRSAQQALIRAEMRHVRDLGLDLRAIRGIQTRYHAMAQPGVIIIPGSPGGPVSACQSNQPQIFSAPYDGWEWRYDWSRSGGLTDPLFQRFLNANTGEVGSKTSIAGIGVDNDDYAQIRYQTAVRQWYTMPTTGQICISLKYEVIDRRIWGSTRPEWGLSAVDVRQQASFYAQTTAPGSSARVYLQGLLDYHEDDFPADWSLPSEAAGNVYETATQAIPGVFTEGTPVLVAAGLETFNYFWTDDCTVTSDLTQRFLIREIRLSATG